MVQTYLVVSAGSGKQGSAFCHLRRSLSSIMIRITSKVTSNKVMNSRKTPMVVFRFQRAKGALQEANEGKPQTDGTFFGDRCCPRRKREANGSQISLDSIDCTPKCRMLRHHEIHFPNCWCCCTCIYPPPQSYGGGIYPDLHNSQRPALFALSL